MRADDFRSFATVDTRGLAWTASFRIPHAAVAIHQWHAIANQCLPAGLRPKEYDESDFKIEPFSHPDLTTRMVSGDGVVEVHPIYVDVAVDSAGAAGLDEQRNGKGASADGTLGPAKLRHVSFDHSYPLDMNSLSTRSVGSPDKSGLVSRAAAGSNIGHSSGGSGWLAERCSSGLNSVAAGLRLQVFGRNLLPQPKSKPLWYAVLDEVHEPQQKLLLIVAVLYTLVGEVEEGGMALGVIALMVLAEVITEWRAKRALAALSTSAPVFARVIRSGAIVTIDRAEVVPGDVILLKAGNEIPADARLLSSSQLQCSEARLTGESVPVHKHASISLPASTPLAERSNMVYCGSIVARGTGKAIVTSTGLHTELGHVYRSSRREGNREKRTVLQNLLRKLAGRLTYVALLASLLGGLLGLVREMSWQNIVLIALSLAFATIPEELPILIAAVLAVGARSLARAYIFVKRLRAMESLAYVDVVLTDKTGTLTQNRLQLSHALVAGHNDDQVVSIIKQFDSSKKKMADSGDGADMLQRSLLLVAWTSMIETDSDTNATDSTTDSRTGPIGSAADGSASSAPAFADPFHAAVCSTLDSAALQQLQHGFIASHNLAADCPFDQRIKLAGRMFNHIAEASSSLAVHSPSGSSATSAAGTRLLVISGAPEAVIERCTMSNTAGTSHLNSTAPQLANGAPTTLTPKSREALMRQVEAAAHRGLRMVAYASRVLPALASAVHAVADPASSQASSMSTLPLASVLPSNAAVNTSGDDTVDVLAHASGLVFLGVLCFQDPLRPEVPGAIQRARCAGIRVSMVTGDHPLAASAIARSADILPTAADASGGINHPEPNNEVSTADTSVIKVDGRPVINCGRAEAAETATGATAPAAEKAATTVVTPASNSAAASSGPAPPGWCSTAVAEGTVVYARATPEHKLQLVKAYQAAGHVVMVTGDGVNDAPALAAADVGLAVEGATDVAREASSVAVVRSDFTALLQCLEEGRRLADNLQHALAFYLGAKAGLILIFIIGTLWQGFPMSPVQVIVLELFMDVGASTSYVAEPAVSSVMHRPPRSAAAPFFDQVMVLRILAGAVSMAGCVLGGMVYGQYADYVAGYDPAPYVDATSGASSSSGSDGSADGDVSLARARGMAFICWLLAHVTLAFNQRTSVEPVLLTKPFCGNKAFIVWGTAVVILAILVGLVPGLDRVLVLPVLSPVDWAAAVGICIGGTFWIEAVKVVVWYWCRSRGRPS